MRPLLLCAALAGALMLAACGGDAEPAARPPVRVAIDAPADREVTREPEVELRGRVSPAAATVMVRGRRADVSGGSFRASVALEPGTNVIDVMASAGSARPALTAIRVRREVPVTVPNVSGLAVRDARDRLRARGLESVVEEDGGLFDRLLPGEPGVCETDPAAGEEVDPGTTVTVRVARRC